MRILTHLDLILGFIKQNLANKEYQKQIHRVLDNENSVFLFSKKFFLFIKEALGEEYQHEYERLFTKFSDYGFSVKSSQNSQDFEDEMLHIFSSIQDKLVVGISYNQSSPKIQNAIPNIAILSQQQKPNYHWLVVNLAILHPFTLSVDEIDFKNDQQTDKFFDDLFSIPKQIRGVTVFDDYCNTDHKKFEYLKNNKIKVFYYTSGKSLNLNEKYKDLSKILSTKKMYYNEKGHARRIIFEGFIVNPDIDFILLNRTDNKMWSVHIRFSEERAKEMLEIGKNYKEFRPR